MIAAVITCPSLPAGAAPELVISLQQATLRLEPGNGQPRRVFPVGVGRQLPDGQASPAGAWTTGPDPRDRDDYIPLRHRPWFYRGLPFIRLEIPRREAAGDRARRPFGIHGPVTPTLIWGTVTAGCIRMRPADIFELYSFAVQHPRLRVRILRGPDRVAGAVVIPSPRGRRREACPEAALGVRRVRHVRIRRPVTDRVCGGVDHWYALQLTAGNVIRVRLHHPGPLRVELYGIRAISTVTTGRRGFTYKVPLVRNNRGDRYLRVTSTARADEVVPYTLAVDHL